jgi:hypothetical protein
VACASRRCSLYHLQKKLIRLQMQALYLLAACLGLLLGSTTSVHGCRGRGHTDPLDGWQIGSSWRIRTSRGWRRMWVDACAVC